MPKKKDLPLVPQEELAYQLFRETNDAVLIIDPSSLCIVEVNPATQRLSGFRKPELTGRRVGELITSAPDVFDGLLETLSDTGLYHSREGFELTCKDGTRKSVNISANKLHTETGSLGLMVMRDITERRNAEAKLRQTQQLMADAQRLAQVGSWSFDKETNEFDLSDTMRSLFDVSEAVTPEELINKLHPDDIEMVATGWAALVEKGTPFDCELRIDLSGSEIRYIHWLSQVYTRSSSRTPVRLMGVAQDITDRKRAEEIETNYRANLEKLQSVLDQVDGFVWEFDRAQNVFTYVSDGVETLLGYPTETWKTQPGFFGSILHPDEREGILRFCESETLKRRDHVMEYQMLDSNGIYHKVRDVVKIRHDADGNVTGLYGLILDVSERTRILEQLERSEQRYAKLFHDSPTALWESDWSQVKSLLDKLKITSAVELESWFDTHPEELLELSGKVELLAVNRGTLEMYDAEVIEDLNPLKSVFGPDSLHSFRNQVIAFATGKTAFACENVNYTLTGRRIHVALKVNVAPGCETTLKRLYGSVVDITDRKHAELLRIGQQRVLVSVATGSPSTQSLSVLIEEIENQSPFVHAAVFSVDPISLTFVLVSPGQVSEELTTLINGITVSEFESQPRLEDSVSFDLRAGASDEGDSDDYAPQAPDAIHRAALACGYSVSSIAKLKRSDDKRLMGVIAAFRAGPPCFNEHEQETIHSFRRMAGLVLEQDAAQRSLRKRTDELNSVSRTYPDALLRVAIDGTIQKRYSGDRTDSFNQGFNVRQKLWSSLTAEEAYQFREAMQKVTGGSESETVNFSVDQNSVRLHFEARFLPLHESTEQIAVLRDVTRLRSTQQALKNANEQFEYMFNESPDAIFVESIDGRVLDANIAACELHGMTREQLIGSTAFDLVPVDEREIAAERVVPIATGEVDNFESRSLGSDGSIIPVSVRISSIQFDGQPALLLHVRDITERRNEEQRQREQERQLAHVSRLTMMGQLVAGIAHEIRQPLWSISTLADVCQEALGRTDAVENLAKIREYSNRLVAEALRVNQITTRMFTFARKGQPERVKANIEELIQDSIAIAHHRAKSNRITINSTVDEDCPEISCDRVLIEQTIVNLLNNAYSALSRKETGHREVNIFAKLVGESVKVSVVDNGTGLPEGVTTEQLFEGFFTTTHTGMGIGLALSRSFVEDHGGKIWAESNATGGMTFQFTLRLDGGVE
jgi:PAS domain S-box-containing protein